MTVNEEVGKLLADEAKELLEERVRWGYSLDEARKQVVEYLADEIQDEVDFTEGAKDYALRKEICCRVDWLDEDALWEARQS